MNAGKPEAEHIQEPESRLFARDGVALRLEPKGYIEHQSLLNSIRSYNAYLFPPKASEAVHAVRKFLGKDQPEKEIGGEIYLHPQVCSYIASGTEQKFRTTLLMILADHRKVMNPVDVKEPFRQITPCAPDAQREAVKIAEERTKQVRMQTETMQQCVRSLTDYNIVSRPHVVDILSSVLSGFSSSSISISP